MFKWDPGDGSDTVEGQGGQDTLAFNGSNAGEKIELSANGPRLRLTRDIAAVTLDADGIETVDLRTLGSPDSVTVDDLTGTDVKTLNLNLAGSDQQRQVTRSGPTVSVAGLAPATTVTAPIRRSTRSRVGRSAGTTTSPSPPTWAT